jgi:hypothetical protein
MAASRVLPCLLTLLPACTGSLFQIKKELGAEAIHGIPFHVHEAADRYTSIYAEEWLELTVSVTRRSSSQGEGNRGSTKPASPAATEYTAVAKRYITSSACAHAIVGQVSGIAIPEEGYTYIKDTLTKADSPSPLNLQSHCDGNILLNPPAQVEFKTVGSPQGRAILVGTSVDRFTRVAQQHYYLNVSKAWEGVTSGGIELGPDGTLSKAQASVEDKTLSTALSSLPIKEAFSSVLGLPTAQPTEQSANSLAVTKLELVLVPESRLYVLSKTQPAGGISPLPLKGSDAGVAFSVTIKRSNSIEKKEAKSSDPKVEFSGTVQLPKPSDSSGGPTK